MENKFLWGASISGYQSEGSVTSDGKLLTIADVSTRNKKFMDNENASKFYEYYKEDIALLGDLGAQCFRLSMSWSRLVKEDGSINSQGVDYYNSIFDALENKSIEPIVTLYHFDLPYFLYEQYGGWRNRKVIDLFADYCEICFKLFGERVTYWLTINEPDITVNYGGHGIDLDGKDVFEKEKYQINHHLALAHAKAVNLCKELCPNAKIGPVFGYVPVYPASSKPEDMIAAMNASDMQNRFFQELFINGNYIDTVLKLLDSQGNAPIFTEEDMNLLKTAKSDFVALNYYKSDVAKDYSIEKTDATYYPRVLGQYEMCQNDFLDRTPWGWEVDQVGIRVMLREVYGRYQLPIIITENGLADLDVIENNRVQDTSRIEYLSGHISEVLKAKEEGVNVFGYCVWSFIDLLSTSQGFEKRYGLVHVNIEDSGNGDYKRTPKESYHWYKEFIKTQL